MMAAIALLLACQRTKWPCVDCLCPVKAGNGLLATELQTSRKGEQDEMILCIRFSSALSREEIIKYV